MNATGFITSAKAFLKALVIRSDMLGAVDAADAGECEAAVGAAREAPQD